jgi:GxxExxY protein
MEIDEGPDLLNDLPEPDPKLDDLIRAVIGACIAVHIELGPGLLESLYEAALCIEFRKRSIPFVRQAIVMVQYQGENIGECRLDFIVDRQLVLEIKAVETLLPVHKAQTLTYLKIMNLHVGLLANFNVERMKQGIKRVINPHLRT